MIKIFMVGNILLVIRRIYLGIITGKGGYNSIHFTQGILEDYLKARRYRNHKIGELFKEIDLSEKKSKGISKILRKLKRNGSPLPEFETDAERTYMIRGTSCIKTE